MSSPNVGAHAPSGYTITTGQEYRLGGLNDQPSFAAVYKPCGPTPGRCPLSLLCRNAWMTSICVPSTTVSKAASSVQPQHPGRCRAIQRLPTSRYLPLTRSTWTRTFQPRSSTTANACSSSSTSNWRPPSSGALARQDKVTQQAFDLIRGSKPRQAFDLTQEKPEVRDRYGRNKFGQSVLLARRLIEAGVPMIQVSWPHSMKPGKPARWDTHVKNAESLKNFLMPPTDQACAALLEDLAARGLLDETLVIWMGEFGRAPNINADGGRDHWVRAFSVALAGGGVHGGQAYGATDKMGGSPRSGQVGPKDLLATIYHCLGLKSDAKVQDALGRPVPIYQGEVIRQILE